MTDERHEDHSPSIEEQITAWVLGELDAADVPAVEAAVAADPALQARKRELESTLGVLREHAPAPALSEERRAALSAAVAASIGGEAPAQPAAGTAAAPPATPAAGRILRFPGARLAAAAALVVGAVWLYQGSDRFAPEIEHAAAPPATEALEANARHESTGAAARAPRHEPGRGSGADFENELSVLRRERGESEALRFREKVQDAEGRVVLGEAEVEAGMLQSLGYAAFDHDAGDASLSEESARTRASSGHAGDSLTELAELQAVTAAPEARGLDARVLESGTPTLRVDTLNVPVPNAVPQVRSGFEGETIGLDVFRAQLQSDPSGVFSGGELLSQDDAALLWKGWAEAGQVPSDPQSFAFALESYGLPVTDEAQVQVMYEQLALANQLGVDGSIATIEQQLGDLLVLEDAAGAGLGGGGTTAGGLVVGAPASPTPPSSAAPSTPADTTATQPSGGGSYRGPGDAVPPAEEADPAAEPSARFFDEGGSGDVDLRGLGYVEGDSDDLRGRGESVFGEAELSREQLLAYYRATQPVLHDGYGRGWHRHQVIHHLRPLHVKESPRDMFFRYYGDNPYVKADQDPLSTFAADVDTASYPLVRGYLVEGHLPPKSAIRTEEFVNYFPNELPAPAEEDFGVQLELAPSHFGNHAENTLLLKVGVKAREVGREDRKPMNLVFVVDKSGSMADDGRLELVKRSLELLVDQLRDDDTVGIVSFNSDGHLELESTPGYERYKIRERVRALSTGGSTNAEAGLLMGYEMAEGAFQEGGVNRVILCSDGVANTGETDQIRILERVRSHSERDIDLTAIGVGMDNHNDVFLEQIANNGNGSCHYVDDFEEAKRVFVEQFTGTLQTVARDVKIQLEFNDDAVVRWRQLGYENRSLAHADFRNDAVDAGEVGAGHEVVALYEIEPVTGVDWEEPPTLAKVRLRWFPDGEKEAVEREFPIGIEAATSNFALASAPFRLSAVAAQYAEVLRRSYWARGDSYEELLVQAEQLVREMPGKNQVRELRDMIRRTRSLANHLLPATDDLAMLVEEARRMRLLQAEVECQDGRSSELEARLQELRTQNDAIEARIRELIGR